LNLFSQSLLLLRSFPRAFWIVVLASFINQMGNMAIVFLVLYLNLELHFGLMQASSGFVFFSVGMLASGMISGRLADKFSAPPIMMFSLLSSGSILLLLPHFYYYTSIVFLCLLLGLACGLYRPASQTYIGQLSLSQSHKLTFSCYRLAINLGMSIGPAMGGFIAYYSFAAIFIINGIFNIIAAAILSWGLTRLDWLRPNRIENIKSEKSLFYNISLWIFLCGIMPIIMIFAQHESTFAIFIQRDLHLTPRFYGLLFTLNTLLLVLFELPLNMITMKWSYYLSLILGGTCIALGFAGLYYATNSWHVIFLAVIWTIGEMIFYPATLNYITEISTEHNRGRYMSMYSTTTNMGLLLGPWLGAYIMETNGAYYLWLSCAIAGLVSANAFIFLKMK